MNVCLIHKGKISTCGVDTYFQGTQHVVQEVCLQDIGFLGSIKNTIADVVIFDVINSRGNVEDLLSLKKIQEITKTIPVLMATNINESSQYREKMLDAGVDVCIQAPFLREELFIRLEKLLERKDSLLFSGTTIDVNSVEVDIRNHQVEVEGKKIPLTKTEYNILLHLFVHKNRVVSVHELSHCLSKEAGNDSLALNIHIFNLRKKIKDMQLIRTVPLFGFTISNALNIS